MSEENKDNITTIEHLKSVRSITSQTGAGVVNYIDAREANTDNALLAEIGYKQELKRQFNAIQVFGIAFSIMGLLPSIASTMAIGITGGPASLVWGWFISGGFILLIGIAMAEMASAIPTSGGLYYWTHHYAPEGYKCMFSFWIGCSNTLALAAGVCSIDYGLAEEILAAVVIATDGKFEITGPKTFGIFAATVVMMMFVTSYASSAIAKLQTTSIAANCFIMILLFIALPIGAKNKDLINTPKFVFGEIKNFSDWSNGFSFIVFGLLPAVWTIGAFDSCVHMSEEAKSASRSVPIGIIGSISACWLLGFALIAVILTCMGTDINHVVQTDFGQPIAQIFYDALGKKWAISMMCLIAACQFLMGCSILTAISRQIWAFSRDDGLPFSNFIKVVNTKWSVPIRAVWFGGFVSIILGLLTLINSTAANALFSMSIAGNYISWSTPMILRLTSGRDIFHPGPFYLGKVMSPVVCWLAVLFQYFIIVLSMFPNARTGVKADTMNYACVVNPSIWILSIIYYFVAKREIYVGPKSNLSNNEYEDAMSTIDVVDGLGGIDDIIELDTKK